MLVMLNVISVLSPVILALYLLGLLYTALSGKSATTQLSISELNDSIKKMSGAWWFMIPVVGLFAFIYNIVATALWFLFVVLQFLLHLCKWVWNEVVIAAGYLLFKIAWHYFVKWPWKVLLSAFGAIRPSFTFANFKIGAWSLSVSFLIAFLGKYLVSTFDWWQGIGTIFTILSVIPIGVCIAHVIYATKSMNAASQKESRTKFVKHLFTLLAVFGIFFAVEFALIYVGTFTGFSHFFSAVFASGTLLGSFFLIFNGGLLVFCLSALPSYSLDFNGSNKELLEGFGKHIYSKGPQYLLAIPACLIPAIIVSIVPYFLSQGASFVAKEATNAAFEYRINSAKSAMDSGFTRNYSAWQDLSITSDSLKKLMAADLNHASEEASIGALETNKTFMSDFYSKHVSEYAALPLGILGTSYNYYEKQQKSMVNLNGYGSGLQVDSTLLDYKSNVDAQIAGMADQNVATPAIDSAAPVATVADSAAVPAAQVATADPTEAQRKARLEEISKHVGAILSANQSSIDASKTSTTLGYLFASLLMCVLMGISFAPAVALFAHVNMGIYGGNDSGKWFATEQIEAAHAANKNQPLLGLVLLPLAIPQLAKLIVTVYTVLQLGSFGVPAFSFGGIMDAFKELPARYSLSNSKAAVADTAVTYENNELEIPAPTSDTAAVAMPVDQMFGDTEVAADTTTSF